MFLIVVLCVPFLLLFLTRVVGFAFFGRKGEEEVPVRNADLQKYLRVSGIVLLGVGALAATFVYLRTQPSAGDDDDIVDYELVGGQVFPVKASEDKAYIQRLKASGGNWDLLTDESLRWINRRWHGRNLATTLVVLSGAGCLGCFYFARKA